MSPTCDPCQAGEYQEESGQSSCYLCQEGTYTAVNGSDSCLSCERNTYAAGQSNTGCTSCPAGKGTRKAGSSSPLQCLCPAGSYAKCLSSGKWPTTLAELDTVCGDDKSFECVSCPVGINCRGYGVWIGPDMKVDSTTEFCDETVQPTPNHKCIHTPPMPEKGHWISKENVYDFFNCGYLLRCPGESFDACSGGFEGFNCATCPYGNYITGAALASCDKCEGHTTVTVLFLGLVVSMLTFGVYFVSHTNRQMAGRMAIAAAMGMLLQTLQYLSVFDKFSMTFPSPFKEFVAALRFLSLDFQAFGTGCVLGNDSITKASQRLLLPGFAVLSMYFWTKVFIKIRLFSQVKEFDADAFINGIGLMWQGFFISVMLSVVSVYQCYPHPGDKDENALSLSNFPEVVCWDTDHIPLVILGVICLAAYVIAPMIKLIAIILKTYEHIRIEQTNSQASASKVARDRKENPYNSFGVLNTYRYYFLVSRYGVFNMHWAILYLFRNMGLAFLPVIIATHPGWQLIMFSLYTAVWAMIIMLNDPWLIKLLTRLDASILISLALISGWSVIEIKEETDIDSSKKLISGMSMAVLVTMGAFIVIVFSFFVMNNMFPDGTIKTLVRRYSTKLNPFGSRSTAPETADVTARYYNNYNKTEDSEMEFKKKEELLSEDSNGGKPSKSCRDSVDISL
jgi:hypothetical protein